MLMSGIFSLLSCAHAGNDTTPAHIKSFSYHYDGTIGRNSHTYRLKVADDGTALLTIENLQHSDYGELTDTVGSDFLNALEELCNKHNVRRFDGFDKVDRYVSDGSGFSLYITYADGTKVNAHGMNSFPAGYGNFSEDLHTFFKPYCESMYAKALQKKIEKGVSGELTLIMAYFVQAGNSGSDRYEVFISRQGVRENNYEVRVRSVSGDFFPEGSYTIYTAVPDSNINWQGVAALVGKYDLVKWMDYDRAAEDYNNCEWFQIELGFEQGHISAMGTLHPDNYDNFRRDFLTILREAVERHGLLQKSDN